MPEEHIPMNERPSRKNTWIVVLGLGALFVCLGMMSLAAIAGAFFVPVSRTVVSGPPPIEISVPVAPEPPVPAAPPAPAAPAFTGDVDAFEAEMDAWEQEMEAWAASFEADMGSWEADFEADMEKWEAELEADMAAMERDLDNFDETIQITRVEPWRAPRVRRFGLLGFGSNLIGALLVLGGILLLTRNKRANETPPEKPTSGPEADVATG